MKIKLVSIFICTLLILTTIPALGNIVDDNLKIRDNFDKNHNSINQEVSSCDNSGNWEEQDKLTASDGAMDDRFGSAVSIDGDYAIVGTNLNDDNGQNSGSAYIYTRSGTSWSQQDILTPSDGGTNDEFGWSVSIDGDYAIVGARYDDDNGNDSGSAYIFYRTGSTWSEQAKLMASETGVNARFGESVSIDGDYAVVGEPWRDGLKGAAYIFKRTGSTWSQQAKITHPDPDVWNGFGFSVSIDGDYAIIGVQYDDDNGQDSGSAYIYKRSGTSWSVQWKLIASDGTQGDEFGNSVSIDGEYAIVGAYADDYLGLWTGSAYIFKRTDTNWSQQTKLTALDEEAGKFFGFSVSIYGEYSIVGAFGDNDNGFNAGAAYIFKRTGTTWSQETKFVPLDNENSDQFGSSASIYGNYAIIGALGDDDKGFNAGAAYVYNKYTPIPPIPILEFGNIKGGILGYSVTLTNYGNNTAYDIIWEMNVTDGFLFPDHDSGEIDQLEPGEETIIKPKWAFGLGRSRIEFHCKYTMNINTTKSSFDVETKQEWTDLGLLIAHAFPKGIQPDKEWVDIDSFHYEEGDLDLYVKLEFDWIDHFHNVRVVTSQKDSSSQEVLYLGACKFINGIATLVEGHITRGDIESGNALWEVELVNGE